MRALVSHILYLYQSATFSPQWQHCSSFTTLKTATLLERRREATTWYADKGHYLVSEPITTDESLRQRLRGSASEAGEVRLYVIGPATTPWGACVSCRWQLLLVDWQAHLVAAMSHLCHCAQQI